MQGESPVELSHKVRVLSDVALHELKPESYDAIVIPGGLGGAKVMRESELVGTFLRHFEHSGKTIAAICACLKSNANVHRNSILPPYAYLILICTAATTVLLAHKIKFGAHVTSYPSVKNELESAYKYDDHSRVVVDGNLITSRGPGSSLEFSLAVVQAVVGKETRDKLAAGMLLHPSI